MLHLQIYAPHHGSIHRPHHGSIHRLRACVPLRGDEGEAQRNAVWEKMLVHFLRSDVMPLQVHTPSSDGQLSVPQGSPTTVSA